jgi:ketosteroid isomerase-like protein
MILPAVGAQAEDADRQMFRKVFTEWTVAFNKKDLPTSCALFSKHVTANYRGAPPKNYSVLCDDFKKVFADKDKSYKYSFELHDIHRSGNLATVRITWHFTVSKGNKVISATTDQGLDVLEKQPDGRWQIVNYLGYEE